MNKEQASERLVVEYAIGGLKRYRILSDRLRSRSAGQALAYQKNTLKLCLLDKYEIVGSATGKLRSCLSAPFWWAGLPGSRPGLARP